MFDAQPGLRGDSYANLSLGNIYFSNLEDRTKYEKHLLHAANFYHEVLKKDDANAFSGMRPMELPLLSCFLLSGLFLPGNIASLRQARRVSSAEFSCASDNLTGSSQYDPACPTVIRISLCCVFASERFGDGSGGKGNVRSREGCVRTSQRSVRGGPWGRLDQPGARISRSKQAQRGKRWHSQLLFNGKTRKRLLKRLPAVSCLFERKFGALQGFC